MAVLPPAGHRACSTAPRNNNSSSRAGSSTAPAKVQSSAAPPSGRGGGSGRAPSPKRRSSWVVIKLAATSTASPAGMSHGEPFLPFFMGQSRAAGQRSNRKITIRGTPSINSWSKRPTAAAPVCGRRGSHCCRSQPQPCIVSQSVSIPPPAAALPLRACFSCGTGAASFPVGWVQGAGGGPAGAPAQPGPAAAGRRNRPKDGLPAGPLHPL